MRIAVAATLLLLLSAVGCQSSSGKGLSRGQDATGGVWPFQPRSIRVHPLTRLQTRDGATVLETWIQLLDLDGYPVRGLGLLTVRLESAGPGYMHQYAWTVDLESAKDADVRFDPVVNGYLLLLEVDQHTLPTRPRVHAVLKTPGGERFSNRLSLDEPSGSG